MAERATTTSFNSGLIILFSMNALYARGEIKRRCQCVQTQTSGEGVRMTEKKASCIIYWVSSGDYERGINPLEREKSTLCGLSSISRQTARVAVLC